MCERRQHEVLHPKSTHSRIGLAGYADSCTQTRLLTPQLKQKLRERLQYGFDDEGRWAKTTTVAAVGTPAVEGAVTAGGAGLKAESSGPSSSSSSSSISNVHLQEHKGQQDSLGPPVLDPSKLSTLHTFFSFNAAAPSDLIGLNA
jgi:hypothetical protein